MKKIIALLTNELLKMNRKMMTVTFFELYILFIKNYDIFFHPYSLICLSKDISVLLNVINI